MTSHLTLFSFCHCGSIVDIRNGLAIQSSALNPQVPQMNCNSKSKSPEIRKNPDFSVLPNYAVNIHEYQGLYTVVLIPEIISGNADNLSSDY